MLCDKCGKKQATVYKAVDVKNKKQFLHLCADCSNAMGCTEYKTVDIGEVFKNNIENKTTNSKVCPICFASITSIKKAGLVGCSKCYEIFKDELESSIITIQGTKYHKGRRIYNEK